MTGQCFVTCELSICISQTCELSICISLPVLPVLIPLLVVHYFYLLVKNVRQSILFIYR